MQLQNNEIYDKNFIVFYLNTPQIQLNEDITRLELLTKTPPSAPFNRISPF